MRKGKGRNTALFLVFCMVLSMLSAIPARAEGDGDESKAGLIAANWVETYTDWNDGGVEKVFVDENGYPSSYENLDGNGVPISIGQQVDYTDDCAEVSISDTTLWLYYRDADGGMTPVSEGLTVEYITSDDPWNDPATEKTEGLIEEGYKVQTNEGESEVVLFKPNKPGYYRFACEGYSDDEKLIVHVDYPEIGIYSAPVLDKDTLCLNIFGNSDNYEKLKLDKPDEIYVNLYNRYSDEDKITLTTFGLSFWDEPELTGNYNAETEELEPDESEDDSDPIDGEDITSYMSVTPEPDKEGWYKITFEKDFFSKEGFNLHISTQKVHNGEDGDEQLEEKGPDAWFSGSIPQSGLLAAEWLDTYWGEDGEKILVGEDGCPAQYKEDENGNPTAGDPIPYTNYKELPMSDSALWIDYKEFSETKPTHILAKDLTVEYFGNEDPREKENPVPEGENGECTDWSLPGDENQLVLFKPDKEGYYRFTYKNDELIVHVDYPEIGFYSNPNRNKDNLYSVNYLFDNSVNDYTGLIEDNKSTIYVNLYNRYSDPVTLKACELTLWDEEITLKGNYDEKLDPAESEDGSTTVDGKDITNYMSVEPESDNEGWYKITFNEDLCLEGGFDLRIVAEKQYEDGNSDSLDAWLSGSFVQPGLSVALDEEELLPDINDKERCSGKKVLHYPGGLFPDRAAMLKFGQLKVETDENGKVNNVSYESFAPESKPDIKIECTKKLNPADSDWNPVSGDDCECKWNEEEKALEIMSYYQQDYKITIGNESVYVHPYMESIEFFTEAVRPDAPDQRVDKRIKDITVKEGNADPIYVMPWIDAEDDWAVNIDSVEIKATLKNEDEEDVTETYIEVGDDVKDGDTIIGKTIKITNKAKENFDITVTAKQNNEYEVLPATLSVTINKLKSLSVTAPTKTVYTEGETFDPAGMTVELVYEDGTKETVQKGYTVTPAEPLKTTDTSVTVSYLGLTTTQKITVNPKQQPTTEQPTTEQPTTQTPPANQPSTEGTVLSSQETGEKAEFTVTSDDSVNPTVAYKKTTEKKEKSVKIPNTVKVNGITYKVTSIADNAFKGNKTVTKVTVGSNITSIGKNAFANCKKLKTVTVSKNVTTVGDNAFKGCAALTKITLPAKTKKIGKDAFSGCKKLKMLTIKSKNLTSKTVSKNAFKGITSKTTIKVPASKLAAYKKLFKKKGLAKNVKVTR